MHDSDLRSKLPFHAGIWCATPHMNRVQQRLIDQAMISH
jgi:hypothetical protein